MYYICPSILRGGAVVARWAHNPKVGGSNPPSATKKKTLALYAGVFYFERSIKRSLNAKVKK